MHPLGDKSGVVVRALLPGAKKVEVQPVHEKTKPKFELARIPGTDVFEGVTKNANQVYAYDLVITDHQDKTIRRAMPFPFCRRWANPICIFSARATSERFMKNSAPNSA
jgi:hypothetical protein